MDYVPSNIERGSGRLPRAQAVVLALAGTAARAGAGGGTDGVVAVGMEACCDAFVLTC